MASASLPNKSDGWSSKFKLLFWDIGRISCIPILRSHLSVPQCPPSANLGVRTGFLVPKGTVSAMSSAVNPHDVLGVRCWHRFRRGAPVFLQAPWGHDFSTEKGHFGEETNFFTKPTLIAKNESGKGHNASNVASHVTFFSNVDDVSMSKLRCV